MNKSILFRIKSQIIENMMRFLLSFPDAAAVFPFFALPSQNEMNGSRKRKGYQIGNKKWNEMEYRSLTNRAWGEKLWEELIAYLQQ